MPRIAGSPIKSRAAIGEYDKATARYTIHTCNGSTRRLHKDLTLTLDVPDDDLRLVIRDVGGNFGTRGAIFAEQSLVAWAARKVGRPVKWTSDRSEALPSDYQGRDLAVEAELALDEDGNGFCRLYMDAKMFSEWGWRIPFIVSLVLLVFSVYIRLRLSESPIFMRMKEEGKGSKAPLTDSFLRYPNNKYVLLALLGATAGQGVVWYTGQFYALFFLLTTLKLDFLYAYALIGLSLIIGTPFFIVFGWLSDRIGRLKIILAGCAIAALSATPRCRCPITSATAGSAGCCPACNRRGGRDREYLRRPVVPHRGGGDDPDRGIAVPARHQGRQYRHQFRRQQLDVPHRHGTQPAGSGDRKKNGEARHQLDGLVDGVRASRSHSSRLPTAPCLCPLSANHRERTSGASSAQRRRTAALTIAKSRRIECGRDSQNHRRGNALVSRHDARVSARHGVLLC